MSRVARRGNVRAIRPGITIPTSTDEHKHTYQDAMIAAIWQQQAHDLAQTAPNSEAHLLALRMAGMDRKLPCNNLRLIVTPVTPRSEWFTEAQHRVHVATKAQELAASRWALAYLLDRQDGGTRHDAANVERERAQAELDQAIEDALRTPTIRRCDVAAKQRMVGRREWAEKYRPDWQAMVDEDLARYVSKSRKAEVQA
jgi:hypothetical protein